METITINQCPLCGRSHTYNLEVEHSFVIKMLMANETRERPKPVKITRIFYCPVKNSEYQGRLTMYETSDRQIRNVTVKGIADE